MRHIGGQFDLEALQTEFVLIGGLHLLTRHLLHRKLSHCVELLLSDTVLTLLTLFQTHETLASLAVGYRFRWNQVRYFENFPGMLDLDPHVLQHSIDNAIVKFKLSDERLIEEVQPHGNIEVALGIADLLGLVNFAKCPVTYITTGVLLNVG